VYYSSAWQVLEERTGSVSNATIQYVWSPVYVDAVILRDRSTQNNGTLDERLWVQQDANWNVTAVVNGSGNVVERDVNDPYGKVAFLTASWVTLGGSAYAWIYMFQGTRLDPTSNLFGNRERQESSSLGRWEQIDPLGFRGGDNDLYRALADNPINALDPSGLRWLVQRGGKERARAINTAADDTIAGLAKKVRLNADEFQNWLTATDNPDHHVPIPKTADTPIGRCAAWFEVPNTIFAAWSGFGWRLGRGKVHWSDFIDTLRKKGFAITQLYYPSAEAFGDVIKTFTLSRDLYGVYTWSHGYPGGLTMADGSQYSYEQWKNDESYKLGLGLLFACFSDDAKQLDFSADALFWGSHGFLSPLSRPVHQFGLGATWPASLVFPDSWQNSETFFGSDFPGIEEFLKPLDQ